MISTTINQMEMVQSTMLYIESCVELIVCRYEEDVINGKYLKLFKEYVFHIKAHCEIQGHHPKLVKMHIKMSVAEVDERDPIMYVDMARDNSQSNYCEKLRLLRGFLIWL